MSATFIALVGVGVAAAVAAAVEVGIDVADSVATAAGIVDETSGSAEQLINNNKHKTIKIKRILTIILLFILHSSRGYLMRIIRAEAEANPNAIPPTFASCLTIGIRR